MRGTTTSDEKAAKMRNGGIEAHSWNGGAIDDRWLEGVNAILVSVPPNEKGCPAYHAATDAITKRSESLDWIGYLSSNGVYGDHDGAWVDENTNLSPSSDRARRRIRAEADWASLSVSWSLPLVIFRLPGIYGPGRSAIDTVKSGRARRILKEGQVFNRMHVEDIAAALKASINDPHIHDLYNLSDDEPSPPQDVVAYACKLLGKEAPPLVPLEEAELSEMAKSFYNDNKRVSNKRMKDALEVKLKYPTYREGLDAILKSSS